MQKDVRSVKGFRSKIGKCQEKEEEVDSTYKMLLEKHGKTSKLDIPKLCLWSRMICSDLHDDHDNPPDIQAFGNTPELKDHPDSHCQMH